ncbi:hypothetical protein Tco_1312970 [Tanacetum coccineum]
MVESSLQNPSSPKITPKEEYVTLDKPESPNPFLPATQVEFTFGEIAFTTNNEVALTLADSKVWVSTPTGGIRREIGYGREIEAKGTLKKSFFPPRWRLLMGQIIQCLSRKTEDLIHKLNKKTREKIVPYPRFISLLLEHLLPEYDNEELTINPTQVFSVHNRTLKPNQPEEPSFTSHMKAICNLDVHVDSKAPEPSSQTEEFNQGQKPSHPSSPTPVVDEMHKEAHFFHFHFDSASRYDASAYFTAEVDSGIFAPNDFIPPQKGMDEVTKNYYVNHIFAGTNPSVLVDQTQSAGDGLKITHTNSGRNEESRADEISKKMKLEDLSDL